MMKDRRPFKTRTVPLSDLSERIFKGMFLSERFGAGAARRPVPIINVKDIVGGRLNTENPNTVPVDRQKNIARYKVRPGDVLIACRGTRLKSAIIPNHLAGFLISANLIAIRLKNSFEPLLLYAFFQSPWGRKILRSNVRSSTMQVALTVSDIGKIEVPILPLEKQKQLAGLINAADQYHNFAIESANLSREIAYGIALESFTQSSSQEAKRE